MKLDQRRLALSLGFFAGLVHIGWSILVALGFAQTLLDRIYALHFLNNPFNVMSFDLSTAAMLTIFTIGVGYIVGWSIAFIWNMSQGKK